MLFSLSFYILDWFFTITYWAYISCLLRAYCYCILAICEYVCAAEKKFQGKGLFTVLATKTLFPLVKHHVFIKSRFGSVGLSTLNTNTNMLLFCIWLIAHAMYQFDVLCHRWFLSSLLSQNLHWSLVPSCIQGICLCKSPWIVTLKVHLLQGNLIMSCTKRVWNLKHLFFAKALSHQVHTMYFLNVFYQCDY